MRGLTGKKIDPRSKRLKAVMLKYDVSNIQLLEALNLGKTNTLITRILTGKYTTLSIDTLVKIANIFHVSLSDIYDTRCAVDEENRAKLLTLNAILDDVKILGKLRRIFNTEECLYMTDMLKNFQFENEVLPKHFLVNTILEADYYSNLQTKYQVKSQLLADKIDDLDELEAFTLLNRILEYNSQGEVVIDKLFYKETINDKRSKIKDI